MNDFENKSVYKQIGHERKQFQAEGKIPDWITTPSWQILRSKYLTDGEPSLKERFEVISATAARHLPEKIRDEYQSKFFNVMWSGWLALSTPVLSNMGTNRGCSVSCSGSYIGDSVYDFYENRLEGAVLSQQGFGTSGYLGDIRARGSIISRGGKADGILPVIKGHIQMARDISQGSTRRGSWAGYIPIEHSDFWEICSFIINNPDDCNIGWCVSNSFIHKLNSGDADAALRYQRALKVKMVTGKGYFFFVDKVNELNPPMYKELGLSVKASNLCTEIALHSDDEHTFTCVLSSLNLSKYDEWRDTDTVSVATIFLDCVAEEFIQKGRSIKGLEKAVRFTEKSRALGLGALGFHTYLQQKGMAFGSLAAHLENIQIFKSISEQAKAASIWMARVLGEPEWCKRYGVRNTHTMAIAPNLSSALICGGVSQGIEPVYMNAYVQGSSAGEINRVNPVLVSIMKERKTFDYPTVQGIIDKKGSVQHVDWLSDEEKAVFKTAFEIDQFAIIRMAAARQQYIDQAQSINLFFSADEKEEVISSVHQEAFNNPMIKSLYYIRSEAGVTGSTGVCEACEG